MPAKHLIRATKDDVILHIYNKGVDNKNLFSDSTDFQVFVSYLREYLIKPEKLETRKKQFTVNGKTYEGTPHLPKNYFGRLELIAYSLNKSEFHLLLHQKQSGASQGFLRSLCTRYSMYFNKKYQRTGTLFAGPYKSVEVQDGEPLIALSANLHAMGSEGDSSLPTYLGQQNVPWIYSKPLLDKLNGSSYSEVLKKHQTNARGQIEPSTHFMPPIPIAADKPLSGRHENYKIHTNLFAHLVSVACFVLLFSSGFLRVQLANSQALVKDESVLSATSNEEQSSININNSVLPKTKEDLKSESSTTLYIVIIGSGTSTESHIKIYEEPSNSSPVIAETENGAIFDYVAQNDGWYQIKLENDQYGYIESQNAYIKNKI